MAPLRYGAGIKGKVVEAIYHKIPIVTTSVGAEGLDNSDGILYIADDKHAFAKQVIDNYHNIERLDETIQKFDQFIFTYFSEDAVWNVLAEDI